jgi:uncharacterized protein DUF5317
MWLLMLLPVVAALLVLIARPNGARALLGLRLRALPLVWSAAALQFLHLSGAGWAGPLLQWRNGLLAELATWAFGLAFILLNLRAVPSGARCALCVLTLGFTLNTLTTVLNGAMPFSAGAARAAGIPEPLIAAPAPHYEQATEETALAVFADVIPVPLLQKVISIGDLLMFIGITALLVIMAHTVGPPRLPAPDAEAGPLATATADRPQP